MLFLLLFLASSDVLARLIDKNSAQKIFLSDLLDLKPDKYFQGINYSRFPKSERGLRLSMNFNRYPMDIMYAPFRARTYTVQHNDTLNKISRRNAVTIEFIKELNGMKSDRLKVGQRLLIPDLGFTLEINKTLNRLYLKVGNVLVKEYPVSTGKSAYQTPVGIFFIQSRYPFPTWFHKGVVVAAASPENYLGSRWLGFDKPQFGLHGTIFPELIGQSVSKGCIRMKNEDVEELYEFIPVGTTVIIKDM